tara:strand:- start:202 stop:963 length:762 start_codon:yes stop_codon:yes gene_type:complete
MRAAKDDMFGTVPQERDNKDLKIIPVSVLDIGPQGGRQGEDHNSTSSRQNYSPFPLEVADLCYQFFLRDSEHIVDPFAGWGERHFKAIEWGKNYWGVDKSPVAIEHAMNVFGVKNGLGDSRNCYVPPHEGLITCPPYWNLESYEGNGIDGAESWDWFLQSLRQIFERFYLMADGGATYCIVVGDWRKAGIYYDLEYQVSKIFKRLGADIVDKIVVSRKQTSKIKIMLPQAKRLGYSVRVHENLLVFRKPEDKG